LDRDESGIWRRYRIPDINRTRNEISPFPQVNAVAADAVGLSAMRVIREIDICG
jgi:hypothetical protein